MNKGLPFLLLFLIFKTTAVDAQQSVARKWNEQVLNAIRKDFARPTIHARNLFHTSVAMYDAWAAYEPDADTYFLGKIVHGFPVPFQLILHPEDIRAAQEEAISFAVYRLIKHRFQNAPGAGLIFQDCDDLMAEMGYEITNISTNYHCGAAELGNYIAEQLIEYGLQDGSNESNEYQNQFYEPVNPPLAIEFPGNPNISDMNRWQPLELEQFVDQAGNPIGDNIPDFLSPEWGSVDPFSLQDEDASVFKRDGFNYKVYYNPGKPAYIDENGATGMDNNYKWGHTLVSIWSSHLDPEDPTMWDISPASTGNITDYPVDVSDYDKFYNLYEGGDASEGHALNPKTDLPYEPNIVLRSDYARVLAEFWADGPDSETPPGHWFTILNTVNDNPELEKRFMGTGPILDDLEWDVKSYFILGGAMHDVAITAWGIKGWYDYIRPVSAIRGMAEFGQGSDPNLPNYHKFGLPLIPDFVELITAGDPLQGANGKYINEVKIYAWKGPDYIISPVSDVAGVGWIRAVEWWPYQRPSFVTPPFAGYISGHSTFSRAAAEVLTALTGDPFFPGGMGEFYCPKNQFLVFEDGPSQDITLQWATYRDASDQCSLSRIWGGIHPPVDDIPGRLIGKQIGEKAFEFALPYFENAVEDLVFESAKVFPNPTNCGIFIEYPYEAVLPVQVYLSDGKLISETNLDFNNERTYMDLSELNSGFYIVVVRDESNEIIFRTKVVRE